jgi:multidrug efflux pump subunit AcrA (membrane-fusion protein)
VREVAKVADPQSRTFHIKLSLDNPETVRPGITATVTFAVTTARQTVTIPASALFHKGNDTAVWVVEPKTHALQLRPVEVVSYSPDQVVLAHGLNNDEEIVSKGVNTVTAGMVIHPSPDTAKGDHV